MLKSHGISVAIDSSGYIWNEWVREAVKMTDLPLLDIKSFDPEFLLCRKLIMPKNGHSSLAGGKLHIKIYLIRHGQTDWNLEGRFQGREDIMLNAPRIIQARECGQALAGEAFKAVITSSLIRARKTNNEQLLAIIYLLGYYIFYIWHKNY